ncbi:2OG-Fe(II) oxygenase superfamily domain-containing protein [Phthorimaea operculella]|nr:2OG-Fe(II) oxygenase superfamily domain-containing protein [Phthorimaea operculella]
MPVRIMIFSVMELSKGTDTCPMKSVVRRIGQQLFAALSGKGLAMLVNHGIADEKLKAVYADLDNFCALPPECQDHYLRDPVNNHGYVKPGMEQFDVTKKELRHSFNITMLNEAAMPAQEEVPKFTEHAIPLAHDFSNLSRMLLQALAYAFAPEEVLRFIKHAIPLAHDFSNLSRMLLQALASAFGVPPRAMLDCHSGMLKSDGSNLSTMRILYYPPVPPEDDIRGCCDMKKFTRCGAHADYGTFTLLAQDSEGDDEACGCCDNEEIYERYGAYADYGTFTLLAQDSEGGLELHGSEKWQPVGHLPGAILVQTGELLAAWTTNVMPALLHRVVVPESTYARAHGRHCVAFFCHPDNHAQLPTLPLKPPSIAPPPTFTPHTHLTLHHRLLNAAHILQKRFRETYA